MAGAIFFGLGHSTRSIDELLAILDQNGIRTLADVRHHPGSRRNPQFNPDALAIALMRHGIRYVHLRELGGRRKPRPDSPNRGWRNESFRGYADHMATPEFQAGLDRLIALGERGPVAFMCAEAVPWRCHRSLIADALVTRGFDVQQIYGLSQVRPHRLTPFARQAGDRLTYPEEKLPSAPQPR